MLAMPACLRDRPTVRYIVFISQSVDQSTSGCQTSPSATTMTTQELGLGEDRPSHLSVILDLSPTQWHLSAQATNPYPLSIETFLTQLLAFLNSHIASKNDNTLAVFGALPGKRFVLLPGLLDRRCMSNATSISVMLYASTEPFTGEPPSLDANSYPPFRMVDTTILQRISHEFNAMSDLAEERAFT